MKMEKLCFRIQHCNLTNWIRVYLISLVYILLAAGTITAQQVGETLSPWQAGQMDIHHINTGKGESTFFIFPDGTTMLLDAGNTLRPKPRVTSPRPDGSRPPGEWIVRYIRRVHPVEGRTTIDYAVLSHFHEDHMGDISEESPLAKSGKYQLSGITLVGDSFRIGTLLDRGWPDYNWPEPLESPMMHNYRAFIAYQEKQNGMVVKRFTPGRNDQIMLVHHPEAYPGFELRNIASNGEVWTGVGTVTRHLFPSLKDIPAGEMPSENMCSNVFRLSYGQFDYYAGGDIPGILAPGAPAWQDLETPVAQVVGPVEVNLLDHHGYLDTENAYFLSVLRPRVDILHAWSPSHPSPRTLMRLLSTKIYPGPRDIFATNMMEANKVVIGSNLEKLASDQGHIVIRVAKGGGSYKIVVLDDSNESFRIKSVHGPYYSR